MTTRRRRIILMIGDIATLALFVLVGAGNHHEAPSLAVLSRNLIPFVASWLVVSFALGTYRRGGLWRFGLTWLIGMPLAVAVRAIWLGRLFSLVTPIFLLAAMSATAVMLLTWRLIAWIVARLAGWTPPRPKALGEAAPESEAA